MKKPMAKPEFPVKAYRLSLDTAETGTNVKLNRTFSISVFDNKTGETTDRWHGILTFSDVSVQEPSLNNKTILLHYRREDFEIIHALLETNFALNREVTCFYKEDGNGKWGGLRAGVVSIPEPPKKKKA